MFQQSKEVSHSYIPTPGIDMGSYEVDGVGRLSIWDAAGHIEYHMTHGMFLGSRYSIAAVVYDLQEEEAIKVNICKYFTRVLWEKRVQESSFSAL